MTIHAIRQQFEDRAAAERNAGGRIEINPTADYVSITMSDGGEYFFQDHEADLLLVTVPDWICAEDYLLATAQNW